MHDLLGWAHALVGFAVAVVLGTIRFIRRVEGRKLSLRWRRWL